MDYKDQRYLVTNDFVAGAYRVDMKTVSKRKILVLHDVLNIVVNKPPDEPNEPIIRGGPEFHRPEDGCLGILFIVGLMATFWGSVGIAIFGRTMFLAGVVLLGIAGAGIVVVHYFATQPPKGK